MIDVTPSREEFAALAEEHTVVSVRTKLICDDDTPIGLYQHLCGDRRLTFLLESAESGIWSRWSFIGVITRCALTSDGRSVEWIGEPPAGLTVSDDPLGALKEALAALNTPAESGLPPLTSGFVGYIGYDMVRRLEDIGDDLVDDLDLPVACLMLAGEMAVLDHQRGELWLISNQVVDGTDLDEAYDDAVDALEAMVTRLAEPREVLTARAEADALDIYRQLRRTNPSPYLYLLRLPGFDVIGSSPEALVTVADGVATTHPIAGTRPRGRTAAEDRAMEDELLADPKERSEHTMLVDLGRNDLGRVCVPGTVNVTEFMHVGRYSHVMHLEAAVTGQIVDGLDAVDVTMSCFPAGTLSGAPKISAMRIIEELETTRRGVYGGVVGYFDLHGNSDCAIAIRTAVLKDQVAHVQAGAGIVLDSVGAKENAECQNKAAAVIQAIQDAGTLHPLREDAQ